MNDRPRFFDDLAGVASGAISALAGLRQEVEAIVRARLDEAIRALDLVRRDEYDAMAEMAGRARDGQEAADGRVAAMEERLAVIEARLAGLETAPKRQE
jgi:BMFP domain-containing protein YqiC